jgi:hypothetical protein
MLLGQPPIHFKIVVGIIFIRSSPTFFKIPVMKELSHAVEMGTYPTKPTIIHAHLPEIQNPACCVKEG